MPPIAYSQASEGVRRRLEASACVGDVGRCWGAGASPGDGRVGRGRQALAGVLQDSEGVGWRCEGPAGVGVRWRVSWGPLR